MIMYLNNHMFSKNYGMAGAVSTVLFLICAVLCVVVLKKAAQVGRRGRVTVPMTTIRKRKLNRRPAPKRPVPCPLHGAPCDVYLV